MATAKKATPKRGPSGKFKKAISSKKSGPTILQRAEDLGVIIQIENRKGLTPAEKIIDILNGLNANEQNCVIKEVLIKVRSDRYEAIDASNKDLEWQRSLMEAFFSLTKEALS